MRPIKVIDQRRAIALNRKITMLRYEYPNEFPNWKIGIPSADSKMNIMPGTYGIIPGKQKSGKTTFLTYLAHYRAAHGDRVLMFPKEMGIVQMIDRSVVGQSGIDLNIILQNRLTEDLLPRYHRAMDQLDELDIEWCTDAETIEEVTAVVEDVKPNTVIIDYAQLLTFAEKQYEGLTHISRELRRITASPWDQMLDMPVEDIGKLDLDNIIEASKNAVNVFTAVQVNRTGKDAKIIQPNHLAGTGSWENDCDVMMILNPLLDGEEEEIPNARTLSIPPGRWTQGGYTEIYLNAVLQQVGEWDTNAANPSPEDLDPTTDLRTNIMGIPETDISIFN